MRIHCAKFVDLAGASCQGTPGGSAVRGCRCASGIAGHAPYRAHLGVATAFAPRGRYLTSKINKLQQIIDFTSIQGCSRSVPGISASILRSARNFLTALSSGRTFVARQGELGMRHCTVKQTGLNARAANTRLKVVTSPAALGFARRDITRTRTLGTCFEGFPLFRSVLTIT
jgi:hypothetical protein